MNRQDIFDKVFGEMNKEKMERLRDLQRKYFKKNILRASVKEGKVMCSSCGLLGDCYQYIHLNIYTNRLSKSIIILHTKDGMRYGHVIKYESEVLLKISRVKVPAKIWNRYKKLREEHIKKLGIHDAK